MPLPFRLPRIVSRLPIFPQVLGLSVFVLLTALAINALVVVFMPPPRPSGYTIAEATRALKGEPVTLRNGRRLKTEVVDQPPAFIGRTGEARSPRGQEFDAFLRQRLAQSLGAAEDDVFIDARRKVRERRFIYNDRTEKDGRDNPPPTGRTMPAPPQAVRPPFALDKLPPNFNEEVTFPAFSAAWKMPDGRYRSLIRPRPWLEPWQVNLLLGFGLTALFIAPVAWLLSRRLTQPIMALAQGAETLGFDPAAAPLSESGPAEVRQATQVLNAMQVRIRKHVESRTAVIAAIAHDLKTPLARLRLRIESLPAVERDRIAQDIAHMDSLIRSALNFASADRMAQQVVRLDLSTLTEALAEDMAELHRVETGEVEPRITVMGDGVALKRILCNLFENAHRYAGGSRLSLRRDGHSAIITVSDNGPGIPEDERERVFEPFHRLEGSRNRDTGGAGLGLSVARALAEAHKGALTVHNRYDGERVAGLDAVLKLPVV